MEGNLTYNHLRVWEPNPNEVCGIELVLGNKVITCILSVSVDWIQQHCEIYAGSANLLVSLLATLVAVLLFTSVLLFNISLVSSVVTEN